MDDETKRELMDSFNDIYDDVESCLAAIRTSNDPELLNKLFRSIHNAKGNASMLLLDPVVEFTHSLEELAGTLRSRRYACSPEVSEVIQISMDILKDIHQRELYGKKYGNLREHDLAKLLERLARSDSDEVEGVAYKTLTFLGAKVETSPLETENPTEEDGKESIRILSEDNKVQSDLVFFQEMALQTDKQSDFWEGRNFQLFEWVMKVNQLGNTPVPYEQLAAATYLHDIGMSFVPSNLIHKKGSYTETEWITIRNHPVWGYDFLHRIPGWEEAAIIILDHHEHIDGSGYPNGKSGDEIHPGAKIVAILDAFFSITRSRADRKKRKSVVRAISEINEGAGTQFDTEWIQCFNQMIRKELKSGRL